MTSRAHLSRGGVDFIADVVDGAFVVRYWGATLEGALDNFPFTRSVAHSDYDAVINPGVMREHSRGWLGYPTLLGHRTGKDWSSCFKVSELVSDAESFTVFFSDQALQLRLTFSGHIDSKGIIIFELELHNDGDEYIVDELWYWLPLPDRANESLDFAGRWSNERNPQRRAIEIGRWVRDSHEGRSGHNYTIGQIALTSHTHFESGESWSISLKWSGDSQYCIEKTYEGVTSIGASEKFLPGEMILAKGESYSAPALIAGYSANGLDGLSYAHHQHLRARSRHPQTPRPLTLNMWEAISFDHNDDRVAALVDVAAEIGVERVVLDDGWFGSRRSDRSGLGDWQISPDVWPNGLKPISKHICARGMQFGLWFEGEMVNPDSDLFRAHPDWILSEQGRVQPTWRHQLVLDLSNPEVFDYVLKSTSAIIGENDISYIKWDHNRTLVDAGHLGRPAIHRQTQSIYRLFDELKSRHPGLEIESCASGGGRIDLGMVDHVDRFWVSDNNDALERQHIQRWTAQFLPLELLGTHIGPTPGHQTGRKLELSFRAATALFGHAGIEWDITKLSGEEKRDLSSWISYYKNKRDLLHSGRLVRVDYPDESAYLYGVIAQDKKEALFNFVQLRPAIQSQPSSLLFSGLDPNARYKVEVATPAGQPGMMLIKPPAWVESGATISGDVLMKLGLSAPILRPESALTIELTSLAK